MKKLFLAVLASFSIGASAQQISEFRAGAHLGLPLGDASDVSSFNIGLDATYFFWSPVENLKLGASTGYTHYVGKDVNEDYWGLKYSYKVKDFGFIPLAASGEYNFAKFFVGLDLGYAISTQKGWDGGFYFQPKAGLNVKEFQFFAFLKGISDHTTMSTIGVGASYRFF